MSDTIQERFKHEKKITRGESRPIINCPAYEIDELKRRVELFEEVRSYWVQLRVGIAANEHNALEIYLKTPANLRTLLDEIVIGGTDE